MKKIFLLFMLTGVIVFSKTDFYPMRRMFRFYCNNMKPTKIKVKKKQTHVSYYDTTFVLKDISINEENIQLKCESLVNKIIMVKRKK